MPPPPNHDATSAYVPPPPPDRGERFAPGEVLAGRYRIVAPLGHGGMGEVYRADDLTLGQPVALKFLPPHLAEDSSRLARFRKEVALARKVSHPNVCRVYDIAEHAGQSFLTMEFVDGENLASVLKRLGRPTEEKAAEIARQLCAALAAVHDQGMLHRDLKPANVMLDGRGKVRLTDFGLAAVAADLSVSDVRSGTPMYQAPEQLTGQEVTVRSDLYGLGLVLYELFTGKRAYPDAGRDTPPSKPSSHVSTLNPAVERVILKCLEADPALRPRSAAEVLAGLPGGDPLAAALAAGETPSPQLVADAPVEGTLRPAVAVALFAAVVVCLLAMATLNDRYKAYRAIPLPSPAELEFKAKNLLRNLGYEVGLSDSVSGYTNDYDYLRTFRSIDSMDLPTSERTHLSSARPALVLFFLRVSPRYLGPVRQEGITPIGEPVDVSPDNPPNDVPGMAGVVLDSAGRLVRLTAVPGPDVGPPVTPVGWAVLLREAGLDGPGVLKAVPNPNPAVIPPMFADETAIWEGTYPDRPDVRVRVEAGAVRGRPVYFRIVHPDRPAVVRPRDESRQFENRFADLVAALIALGMMVALAVFSIRNIRRADVRGALLLGGTIFTLDVAGWALHGRHLVYLGVSLTRFFQFAGVAFVHVALVFAAYLTFEPVVRRRSPHLLTAWTRLFAGRWRDPLVGRDLLVGVSVAAGLALVTADCALLGSPQGGVVISPTFTAPFPFLFDAAGRSVGVVWYDASIFALVLAVVRRQWVALAVVVGLLGLLIVPNSSGWATARTMFMVLIGSIVFVRFGVLALAAMLFALELLTAGPITLDTSAWYFGASSIYLLAVAGLAVYGGVVSLGGRPTFGPGNSDNE
jgi:serine/threonine-protein kinase